MPNESLQPTPYSYAALQLLGAAHRQRSAAKSIDEHTNLGYLSSLKKGGGQGDQAFVHLLGRPMVPWQSNQWRGSRQGVTMSAERTAVATLLPYFVHLAT